jgi:integrase
VRPTGRLVFILYRRFPGSTKPTRRQIGCYPDMTLAQARVVADDWLAKIRKGIDPTDEIEQIREANIKEAADRRANSVEAVLETYLLSKAHLRTVRSIGIELKRELKSAGWLDRPIRDITKADVVAMVNKIKVDRPGQARTIYNLVKGFFNWAVRTDDYGLDASPCAKIDTESLVGRSQEVDRTLTNLEIRALWKAAEQLAYPFGDFFRLLLLTGLRRSEVANCTDEEIEGRRWVIPGRRMKNGRDHLVPIAPAIEGLLGGLPRFQDGPFLFSTTGGRKAIAAFSTAKTALDEGMKAELAKEGHAFEPWTIHDIRRTVRTRLSSLGVQGHICERILAHAQPEIERRYNKYAFEQEKLDALQVWHDALEGIINPRPDLRVVA